MYKRIKIQTGGVLLNEEPIRIGVPHLLPDKFKLFKFWDSRGGMGLITNQGNNTSCAGHAFANALTLWHLQATGIHKEFNGDYIYIQTKKYIDKNLTPGTTLEAVFQCCKRLGYIPNNATAEPFYTFDDFCYVIQTNLCAPLAFNITENWTRINKKTGFIHTKYPKFLGGHGVNGLAFDRRERWIGWENSYDDVWGYDGCGRMTETQFNREFRHGLSIKNPFK